MGRRGCGCRVRSLPRMVPGDDGADGDAAPSSASAPVVACVGAVVFDGAGRLLLVRRGHAPSAGLWSLPGGRVEAGESAAQAIEREVLEETGLRVRPGAVVGRVQIPGPSAVYDIEDLACTLDPPDQQPVAGDDAADVLFADAAALGRLPCTPDLLVTLRAWGVLPR
jgi:8-oxo-dGTP diphosphatase